MSPADGLAYCYTHPQTPAAGLPVLLFLHGIGDAFVGKERVGHRNLFQQGPPKHLVAGSASAVLRDRFTVIAPQLRERETLWTDVVDDVSNMLTSRRSETGKLYIVGFSKGGLGAFQLALGLRAAALVTIDAAPMDASPTKAADGISRARESVPFWAIHTAYSEDGYRLIQEFNELLTPFMHPDLASEPQRGARCRTCHEDPSRMPAVKRHGWICDCVSQSDAAFRWLLQH